MSHEPNDYVLGLIKENLAEEFGREPTTKEIMKAFSDGPPTRKIVTKKYMCVNLSLEGTGTDTDAIKEENSRILLEAADRLGRFLQERLVRDPSDAGSTRKGLHLTRKKGWVENSKDIYIGIGGDSSWEDEHEEVDA
tara:strand:+ start:1653 stop:2063 length:411 start_codon:yes stop_codon:yes gene_type:complete